MKGFSVAVLAIAASAAPRGTCAFQSSASTGNVAPQTRHQERALHMAATHQPGTSPNVGFPNEEEGMRQAYEEWLRMYGPKSFDAARFENFKHNLRLLTARNMKMREEALAKGLPEPEWFLLNEYGDYSMAEYEAVKAGRTPAPAKANGTSTEPKQEVVAAQSAPVKESTPSTSVPKSYAPTKSSRAPSAGAGPGMGSYLSGLSSKSPAPNSSPASGGGSVNGNGNYLSNLNTQPANGYTPPPAAAEQKKAPEPEVVPQPQTPAPAASAPRPTSYLGNLSAQAPAPSTETAGTLNYLDNLSPKATVKKSSYSPGYSPKSNAPPATSAGPASYLSSLSNAPPMPESPSPSANVNGFTNYLDNMAPPEANQNLTPRQPDPIQPPPAASGQSAPAQPQQYYQDPYANNAYMQEPPQAYANGAQMPPPVFTGTQVIQKGPGYAQPYFDEQAPSPAVFGTQVIQRGPNSRAQQPPPQQQQQAQPQQPQQQQRQQQYYDPASLAPPVVGTQVVQSGAPATSQPPFPGTQVIQSAGSPPLAGTQVLRKSAEAASTAGAGTQVIQKSSGNPVSKNAKRQLSLFRGFGSEEDRPRGTCVVEKSGSLPAMGNLKTQVLRPVKADPAGVPGTKVLRPNTVSQPSPAEEREPEDEAPSIWSIGTQVIQKAMEAIPNGAFGTQVIRKADGSPLGGSGKHGTVVLQKEGEDLAIKNKEDNFMNIAYSLIAGGLKSSTVKVSRNLEAPDSRTEKEKRSAQVAEARARELERKQQKLAKEAEEAAALRKSLEEKAEAARMRAEQLKAPEQQTQMPGKSYTAWGRGEPSWKTSAAPSSSSVAEASPSSSGAPAGMPELDDWVQNDDGTITGFIKNSGNFKDGTKVTTSVVSVKASSGGMVVQTVSGSKYYLV